MILNLDKVKPIQKKIVELKGKSYEVPNTLTVDIQLEMMSCQKMLEKDPTNIDAFDKIITNVWKVFSIKNDLTLDQLKSQIGLDELVQIVDFLSRPLEDIEKKSQDGKPSTEEKKI